MEWVGEEREENLPPLPVGNGQLFGDFPVNTPGKISVRGVVGEMQLTWCEAGADRPGPPSKRSTRARRARRTRTNRLDPGAQSSDGRLACASVAGHAGSLIAAPNRANASAVGYLTQ